MSRENASQTFQSGMINLNNHFKYSLPTVSGTQPNITLWISTLSSPSGFLSYH